MANRFDCAVVNAAMVSEENVPGVAPAVMRAVRTAHAARLEADRRAREAAARNANNNRRPNYYNNQPGSSAAASASQPAQQQPSQPTQPSQQRDPRQTFPCHTCNVRGHWKNDGACRPEDVRANLARLAAMLGPQLALPAPDGTGMSNHV